MDKKQLSELMRKDWDRRISHNYRFWMSDGHADDASMWVSGERDFSLMCGEFAEPKTKTLLEIGCGVGRLLRAAAKTFGRVIGLDVSAEAIKKCSELLKGASNVELLQGNGFDLEPLPAASIDLVLSFAAITSAPVEAIANYLCEINRVLKPDGEARLQIYFGKEQTVAQNDTLHLRAFPRENFEKAVTAAGLKLKSVTNLSLPFEISYKELGFEAVKLVLQRDTAAARSSIEVAQLLSPAGEKVVERNDDLEYWMSVNYAKELAEQGRLADAQATLEYAVNFSKNTTIDVRDLLERITGCLTAGRAAAAETFWAKNLSVLKERFPKLCEQVEHCRVSGIEVRQTQDGAVIFCGGQCLDHAGKPREAALVWAKRTLVDARLQTAKQIALYGFGAGYHVEELLNLWPHNLAVIEPHTEVFKAALESRDLTGILRRVSALVLGTAADLTCLDENSELVVRTQTQVTAPEYLGKVKTHFYATRGLRLIKPKIAVLGPIQGGTLSMLNYTARALALEEQRVREIDMRGFAGGYLAIEQIVKNELIRSAAENTYVETLSKIAFSSLIEKPIDILICMAQAPIVPDTITELKKRGVITVLWFVEDYNRFHSWKVYAPHFDFILVFQKGDCIEALKKAGCSEVHYLPTACDPYVHVPLKLSAEEQAVSGSPISFMGAGYHNRQQMFAALANLPFKIWGTEWPTCRPFDKLVQENGRRLTPEEYIKVFNGSQINLNLHSSTERDGVEFGDFVCPRTFELAGIGAFQLVDERSLLPELYEIGKEIITFRNINDLKEKIDYYLNHPDERQTIAARARERSLREHTYQHRLRKMLSIIYSSRYEQLARRVEQDPWQKMLERSKNYPELHARCQAAYHRGEEPGLDGLVADVVTGRGTLTDTEQKLLFLFHVSKQIIRLKREEMGGKGPDAAPGQEVMQE